MKASIKSIVIFCLLAFIPVWAVCFLMLAFGTPAGGLVTVIFAGFMFMPAIASILTRLICKEGFSDMYIRPRFRGNIGKYLLAWFLPILLTLAGAALYFLLKPAMFDRTFSVLRAQGVAEGQIGTVLISSLAAMLFGPLLNLIPAFGEELGWRGYLMPRLATRMPAWAASLVSGAIWGLWHAPMIALGHNYGVGYAGYPWVGILLMILFCIFFGIFLTWLTRRTGSAIPAALAHGGLNAVASIGVLFCLPGYSPLVGPLPMGTVGGLPVLIAGLVCLLALIKKDKG